MKENINMNTLGSQRKVLDMLFHSSWKKTANQRNKANQAVKNLCQPPLKQQCEITGTNVFMEMIVTLFTPKSVNKNQETYDK